MNLFTGTSWALRALRRRSVTSAVLFASSLLGFSIVHWLRVELREAGVGWLGLFFIPIAIIGLLARKETEWMPDETRRRRWSYGLVVGSLVLAIGIARIKNSTRAHEIPQSREEVFTPPLKLHKPPGK